MNILHYPNTININLIHKIGRTCAIFNIIINHITSSLDVTNTVLYLEIF
jgi:hypothetical protein